VSRCDKPCYCSWPPLRRVQSTRARYTVEEIEAAGNVRVFRYLYMVAE